MTTTRGFLDEGNVPDRWPIQSLLALVFDPISTKALLVPVPEGNDELAAQLEWAVVRGWMLIKAVQHIKKMTKAARCIVL